MPTIIATPGSASANSLAELAEAASYFATRAGGQVWENYEQELQERAMITAAYRISAELYRGQTLTSEQALAFPRLNIYAGGVALSSSVVPTFAKWAQFEEALAILIAAGLDGMIDPLAPAGTEQFKSIGVGDIRLEFRDVDPKDGVAAAADDPSRTLSPQAYRLLRPYLLTTYIGQGTAGARNFRIAHN